MDRPTVKKKWSNQILLCIYGPIKNTHAHKSDFAENEQDNDKWMNVKKNKRGLRGVVINRKQNDEQARERYRSTRKGVGWVDRTRSKKAKDRQRESEKGGKKRLVIKAKGI